MRYPAPWRGLLLAAGLILAGTSILHAVALSLLTRTLRAASLYERWGAPLTGLWFLFSTHLAVIGGYAVVASLRPRVATDESLLLCALLLAADTALLGGFMGFFVGTLLVGVCTGLVIVARAMRGASRSSAPPAVDQRPRN